MRLIGPLRRYSGGGAGGRCRRGQSRYLPSPRAGGAHPATPKRYYSEILIAIGRKGDLTSKVRESLVSIGRLVTFIHTAEGRQASNGLKEMRAQLKTHGKTRRKRSLTDHASYLSNKITFVLDAMLGVVNLEQKQYSSSCFSVMAVVADCHRTPDRLDLRP